MPSFNNTAQSEAFVIKNKPQVFTAASFSKNEINLSEATFEKWRSYIYDSCGIYFQDNKKYLLESRLMKRINHLNLNSFEDYLDFIKFNAKALPEKRYLYEAFC